MLETGFAVLQEILRIIGVTVSFSIAIVSFMGSRRTGSISLLRLATSFLFLGFGFSFELIPYLAYSIPVLEYFATTSFMAGLLFETTGYFFLAFSHAIDVMFSRRLAYLALMLPMISLSPSQLSDVLSVLSFYFVLYGMVETLYSYKQTRRPDTLLVSSGLAFLAVGILFEWLSVIYPFVNIFSLFEIIAKEMGLFALFVPVLNFIGGRMRSNGTV